MKSAPLTGRPDWAKPKPVTGDAPLPLSREIDPPTLFPVDALGMTDPQIENALAVAAGQPIPGSTPGGPQVPKVDGRSGAGAVANTAQPSGASSISIPSPSL